MYDYWVFWPLGFRVRCGSGFWSFGWKLGDEGERPKGER